MLFPSTSFIFIIPLLCHAFPQFTQCHFFFLLEYLCLSCSFSFAACIFIHEFIPCSSFSILLCSPPLSMLCCRPISRVKLFKPHTYSSQGAEKIIGEWSEISGRNAKEHKVYIKSRVNLLIEMTWVCK